jgi:pimeloyl-ACP methyl ester carboxylesterase
MRAVESKECVVLLRGLWRTRRAMLPLEWFLKRRGYDVVNITLPTLRFSIETLASEVLHKAISSKLPPDAGRVHFVTHSMGGIVVRQYLATHPLPNLGRVVMLAPPNAGNPIAERVGQFALGRIVLGRAGRQLGVGAASVPRRLGPVNFELGVIAGDAGINPLFGGMLKRPHDGTVSVESTKVDGMADLKVIRSSHTFIIWSPEAFKQVLVFLKQGRFD